MSYLSLVPIYFDDRPKLLYQLNDRLQETFRVPARIRRPDFNPQSCYDSSRGQYNSTLFLERLLVATANGDRRILGVTTVDLFIPVLTYVFGEAQLDGLAAVVSTHRLDPEAYGLESDPSLLLDRLEKESVHELGHTFGLLHCPDPECVMHASTYVEEIDLKQSGFCAECREAVDGDGKGG